MPELPAITIVEDRTAESRCDRGFLTLERLRLRNEYSDGSRSEVYDCDLVSRRGVDAAAENGESCGETMRVEPRSRGSSASGHRTSGGD